MQFGVRSNESLSGPSKRDRFQFLMGPLSNGGDHRQYPWTAAKPFTVRAVLLQESMDHRLNFISVRPRHWNADGDK